ncbi:ferritin-like domain-containing protein [Sphingomonas endolithica]|uniref:ferritin-like domain-containing protein n=1 Tax=Sphingomonas endolithica TaxID=2972485 RepID=UPI0021AE7868|nr:ferritin-like protein [Sphingomonas sp. ZFBP2030]
MPLEAVIEEVSGQAVVIGSREQLLHLLAEASEIEHTLMCSYLYAAFSLKRAGEPGVSFELGETLERWRKVIMDVAVEEMGHLMIVANLTVAIGGRPHFGRPNFPVAPGYFPSGVAVRLTGFNAETLKHFVFLERPQDTRGQDSAAFEQDDYCREQAHLGLMPSAQDYATIGHLYEAIRTNLIAVNRELGGDVLFLGGKASQIGPPAIDLDGVEPIVDIAGAGRAIDIIVEQGEGSSADREESHYRSFLQIQRELDAAVADDPNFAPAWPAANSPVLRQPPEPEGKVFVNHPQAAELLDFACSTYGLLLRCLVQCFARSGNQIERDQASLMSAAIELMHVLGAASTALVRLPATREGSGVHAGMTFTMLRGVEPLLPGRVERRLLLERVDALSRTRCKLPNHVRQAIARASEQIEALE